MLCCPLTQYVIWCFTPCQPLRLSQGVLSTQKDMSVIQTCYQNVLPEQQQQQQQQQNNNNSNNKKQKTKTVSCRNLTDHINCTISVYITHLALHCLTPPAFFSSGFASSYEISVIIVF